jgi:hypothetical protein
MGDRCFRPMRRPVDRRTKTRARDQPEKDLVRRYCGNARRHRHRHGRRRDRFAPATIASDKSARRDRTCLATVDRRAGRRSYRVGRQASLRRQGFKPDHSGAWGTDGSSRRISRSGRRRRPFGGGAERPARSARAPSTSSSGSPNATASRQSRLAAMPRRSRSWRASLARDSLRSPIRPATPRSRKRSPAPASRPGQARRR